MSGVVLYKAGDWYEHPKPTAKRSYWFKQRPPPPHLRSRVVIPHDHLLWDAWPRNEVPYAIIQLAFEHGMQCGRVGEGPCPYRGGQAVAWFRGYYYASWQINHSHEWGCRKPDKKVNKPKEKTIYRDFHDTWGSQSKSEVVHPASRPSRNIPIDKGGALALLDRTFPAYEKTNGGWEYWDASYAAVPNIDSDKWRNSNFIRQMPLPTDKRPTDKNIYCREPCGEYYTVIPKLDWQRKRGKARKGNPPRFIQRLNRFLDSHRGSGPLHTERNAMTIGFIDLAGKNWGKWWRSDEIYSLVPCVLAAMVKEKELLGISGHGFKRNNHYYPIVDTKKIPIKGMSEIQFVFHHAWQRKSLPEQNLPERFRTVLWVHFVSEGGHKEKAQALVMTADGYRFLIDDAHEAMMRIIIAQAEPNE